MNYCPHPKLGTPEPSIDEDMAYVLAISDAMEQAQTEKESRAAVAEINRQFGIGEPTQ